MKESFCFHFKIKKISSYFPAVLWLLIILFLSGFPGKELPKLPVWQFDKLVHTLMYFILSVCLLFPFSKQFIDKENRLKVGIIVVLLGIFYGGLMEILQIHIFINRSGNWYDFIANSLGAILGVLTFPIILKYLPIKRWF